MPALVSGYRHVEVAAGQRAFVATPEKAILDRRHLVREVLQAKLLASLQRAGAMIPLAFHGGTALRFLYSIHRFSEDLDFALERPRRGYDFCYTPAPDDRHGRLLGGRPGRRQRLEERPCRETTP